MSEWTILIAGVILVVFAVIMARISYRPKPYQQYNRTGESYYCRSCGIVLDFYIPGTWIHSNQDPNGIIVRYCQLCQNKTEFMPL